MLKPDRENFDKWISLLPEEYKPSIDTEYGKMLSAYRAGVIAAEQRHVVPVTACDGKARDVILRAVVYLEIFRAQASDKQEIALEFYVGSALADLRDLIKTEDKDE